MFKLNPVASRVISCLAMVLAASLSTFPAAAAALDAGQLPGIQAAYPVVKSGRIRALAGFHDPLPAAGEDLVYADLLGLVFISHAYWVGWLLFAVAAGLAAVYPMLFQADAALGRSLGYRGKLCIHPRQIPVIHAAFAPTPAEAEGEAVKGGGAGRARMVVMGMGRYEVLARGVAVEMGKVFHYDRGALDRYLDTVGGRLLQPLAGSPPFAASRRPSART